MKYDFESILDRKGKDALAVDAMGKLPGFAPKAPRVDFDVIPMWIADMNFPTCPAIQRKIIERVKHPAFGYFMPSQDYFDAIISWQKERNGVTDLSAEQIGYENGVLGGLVSALNACAKPGDSVLLHSPTYIGFTNSIENAGFQIVHSELKLDKEGIWRMDYQDMDRKIKDENIRVAIFCNPHNPCGRVWEKEELEQAMEVYRRNDCVVISDEIWSDLILGDHKHIPLQSVSEDAKKRTIALYAPSKTFNLAGLIGSYHIVYDQHLREQMRAAGGKTHYNSMNILSMYALIGAYSEEGREWLEELRKVLNRNVEYAYQHIVENYEGITLSKPEGTYMLFLDCTEWCEKHGTTVDDLLESGWYVGVAWQDGRPFHGKNAIRMNLALPYSKVAEAFARLDQYVFLRENLYMKEGGRHE